MKITNAILSLLLVAAASGENIDSFDKQAGAAIEKASHLRGSADDCVSEIMKGVAAGTTLPDVASCCASNAAAPYCRYLACSKDPTSCDCTVLLDAYEAAKPYGTGIVRIPESFGPVLKGCCAVPNDGTTFEDAVDCLETAAEDMTYPPPTTAPVDEDADDEGSEDALVAANKQNRNGRRRANQWLKAHNDERKDWQSNPQVMMKWSEDLKEKAEYWADELVLTCNNRIPPKASGLTEYGFNIAMKQGQSDFRTVDQVFKLWDNKMYLGYPNNKEMSQVLWKATEYVGCADAGSADNASKTCTASVCFYARAGNCGMGQINSWDEHLKKINDERSCGPCPDDHPNCKECNSMKKGRKVRC